MGVWKQFQSGAIFMSFKSSFLVQKEGHLLVHHVVTKKVHLPAANVINICRNFTTRLIHPRKEPILKTFVRSNRIRWTPCEKHVGKDETVAMDRVAGAFDTHNWLWLENWRNRKDLKDKSKKLRTWNGRRALNKNRRRPSSFYMAPDPVEKTEQSILDWIILVVLLFFSSKNISESLQNYHS